jgi:hypothetical protein
MFKITAKELNTGGGSMVTIIESDEWDHIMVTNDEVVAIYSTIDAFWGGENALQTTVIEKAEQTIDDNKKVTRFEVIDQNKTGKGRHLVKNGVIVQLSYQDDNATLKVFLKDRK